MVEQRIPNPQAGGSSPSAPAGDTVAHPKKPTMSDEIQNEQDDTSEALAAPPGALAGLLLAVGGVVLRRRSGKSLPIPSKNS